MKKKTILLVEDNPDDEAMALFALNKHAAAQRVVVARDGEEALDYLFGRGRHADRDLPDLVLMDIQLPRVNGIEVLRRVREAETSTRLVPIVMLTTSDEDRDRQRCYELCANSFIRKPVDFDEFVERIRQISVYWLVVNETPPAIASHY